MVVVVLMLLLPLMLRSLLLSVEYVHAKRHGSCCGLCWSVGPVVGCGSAVVCLAVLFLLLLPALRCRCCCCCLLLLFFVVVGVFAVSSLLLLLLVVAVVVAVVFENPIQAKLQGPVLNMVGVCPKGLPPRGFLVGVCLG